MNRTTAIIVTVATTLVCGIPSCILMCIGVMALFGTQMPEVMAQNPGSAPEEIMLGAGMFLCVGAVLLIVPILVGAASFYFSKKDEPEVFEYVPPPMDE